MKTYTQKQYDNAKKRAYDKGFAYGFNEGLYHNPEVVERSVDEVLETAREINSWKKWEQFDFDWTVIALVVVCLGVLVTMIF